MPGKCGALRTSHCCRATGNQVLVVSANIAACTVSTWRAYQP